MRVKFKQSLSGPDATYEVGETVTWDKDELIRLCAAGITEPGDDEATAAIQEAVDEEENRLTAEADAKANAEADAKATADAEKAEADAKAKADAEKAEADAKATIDADAAKAAKKEKAVKPAPEKAAKS